MDEKQLQTLWDLKGKDQGFTDFNEFKTLLGNNEARKLYFEESNNDLGFTDLVEFESILGLGKLNEGSLQGSQNTSATSTEPLETSQVNDLELLEPDKILAGEITQEDYELAEQGLRRVFVDMPLSFMGTDTTRRGEFILPEYAVGAEPVLSEVTGEDGKKGFVLKYTDNEGNEQLVAERQKEIASVGEEYNTFTTDLKNQLLAGLSDLNASLADIPEFAYRLFAVPQNLIADAIENNAGEGTADWLRSNYGLVSQGEYNPLSMLGEYAKEQRQISEELDQLTTQYEQDILGSLTNGNFLDAGKQIGTSITRSLPMMLGMVATSGVGTGAGLGVIGRTSLNALPFASGAYQEMDDSVPENVKLLASLGKGFSEVIFEQSFGTLPIMEGILNKSIGKVQLKQIAEGYLSGVLAKNGIPASLMKGALSEMATELSNEIIDVYGTGVKEAIEYRNIINAGIVGAVMDGALTSVNNAIPDRTKRTRANELEAQILELMSDISKTQTESQANTLEVAMEAKVTELDTILNEATEVTLTEEQTQTLNDLSVREAEIETLLEGGEISQEGTTALQAELTSIDAERQTVINNSVQQTEQETTNETETTTPLTEPSTDTESTQPSIEIDTEIIGYTEGTQAKTTFFNDLSNEEARTKRITDLKSRIDTYRQNQGNIGISGVDPEQQARHWRDVTEYAVLSIVDGTVKTAKDLARVLGSLQVSDDITKAFTDAKVIADEYNKSLVKPKKQAVKKTVRGATRGGVQGETTITNKQALTNQIRTLNRGAKDMATNVKELAQTIGAYIQANKPRLKGTSFNQAIVTRIARSVSGITTPKQLTNALSILDKAIDNAVFRKKLEDVSKTQRRVSNLAKSKRTPKDLSSAMREFAKVNPLLLNEDMVDGYLDMLQNVANLRTSLVDNISAQDMQRYVDMAKANQEVRDLQRSAAQTPSQEKLEDQKEKLITKLREAGVPEVVIDEVNTGDKLLSDIITDLQTLIDGYTETKEQHIRSVAREYTRALKENKQTILDAQPNAVERRMVEEFYDLNITEENISKGNLATYITSLFNLLNNNSAVGLGQVITEVRRQQQLNRTQEVNDVKSSITTPNLLFQKLNKGGAVSGSQLFNAVVKSRDFIGRVHEFFGTLDIQINTNKTIKAIAERKKRFNDLLAKHKKDLDNNPVGEVLMSVYADVVQYKSSWTAERIANEYALRIQAWGKSLDRMNRKADDNTEYARVNKNAISNLTKAMNKVASVEVVDGENVYTPKYTTPSDLWNQLSNGHKEVYNFMRAEYDALKDAHFAVSRVYGGLDVETDWVNYFPRTYNNIPSTDETRINRQLASTVGRVQDIDIGMSFNSSLVAENTGSGQTRLISGDAVPRHKTLNPRSINTFLNEIGSIEYDIETMPSRQYTAGMLDIERNGLEFDDQLPIELYKEKVAQKILGDRFTIGVSDLAPEPVKTFFSKMSKLGTATALGGTTQFIKQTTPALEVLGRLDNPKFFYHAISAVAKNEAMTSQLMDMGDIAVRNIENEIALPKNSNVMSDGEVGEVRQFLKQVGVSADKVTDALADLSLTPLKWTDEVVARVGWLALYMDYQARNNNGVVDLTKPNKQAIAFANTQNSIVMNESDSSLQGKFTQRDWVKLMFPFQSFSINAKITLIQTVDKLAKARTRQEIALHSKELAGNLANIAMFNLIGQSVRWAAIGAGGWLVATIIENSDIDDEDKKRLLEDIATDKESRRALNDIRSTGYLLNDFAFGGLFGRFTEPATEPISDYLIRSMYGDNELRARGYTGSRRALGEEWYEGLWAVMGTAGILGQRVTDTWGQARDFTEADEKYITRRFGQVNAEGTDIVIDDAYLSDEYKGLFAKPEWEKSSVLTSILVNSVGILGGSDQFVSSTTRYANNIVRNLLMEEHGLVSKQSKKEMLDAFNTRNSINVLGVPVPLKYDQKLWYADEYFNRVLEEKKRTPKHPDDTVKEYESMIKQYVEWDMEDRFFDKYPEDFNKTEDLKQKRQQQKWDREDLIRDYRSK